MKNKRTAAAYLICLLLSVLVHVAAAGIEFPVQKSEQKNVRHEKLKISLKKFCPVEKTVHPPVAKPLPKPPEKKKEIKKTAEKKIKKQVREVKKIKAPEPPEPVIPQEPVQAAETAVLVQEEEEETVYLPVVMPEPEPEIPPFDYDAYMGGILELIEAVKSYPYLARKKGQEGVVSISVLIGMEGDAIDLKLEKSSGFSLLDREAMKLVASVFPLENGSGGNIRLVIPVRYMLN